jgi:DNA-binding winged helix-turn-helix (wHTH) protein
MRYVFADCVCDITLATLHRAGRDIPLRPKVFHLLQYLLEQRAHLVAKDVLCAQVWPGQCISDAALEGCIKLARQAIGDSGQTQRLIQARRGYGYRFVGVVEELAPSKPIFPGREPGVAPAGMEEAARRHQELAAADGERKLVTLLGCTLAHTPVLRDRLGLDGLHSRMRTLYTLAQREVQQYGGMLSRFVERARELASLHALLAQTEAGHGQAVGIVGEPGLGKSRLLMEWHQQLHAHGLAFLAGHGLSYGSTTPYLPGLDLLREHCGITPADSADVISTKVREGCKQ